MTNNTNSNPSGRPKSLKFYAELFNQARLVVRLMIDSRVSPWLKLLPVGAMAYVVWPIDFPGPIDDLAVLGIGTTLFVKLCPPGIVDEHLRSIYQAGQSQPPASPHQDEDIIDGEFYESKANNSQQNRNWPN